jgi:hypothetical protein
VVTAVNGCLQPLSHSIIHTGSHTTDTRNDITCEQKISPSSPKQGEQIPSVQLVERRVHKYTVVLKHSQEGAIPSAGID